MILHESEGRYLAVTVLCVPRSLGSGRVWVTGDEVVDSVEQGPVKLLEIEGLVCERVRLCGTRFLSLHVPRRGHCEEK